MIDTFRKLWHSKVPSSGSKIERKIQEHKERAEQLQRESQYEAALSESARVRDLVAKNFGQVNRDYVWALRTLGVLKQQLGDYEAAEKLFEDAHGIAEREFGGEDADTGRILYCWGRLYGALGDWEKASSYLGKALAIRREELGPGHFDVHQEEQDLADVDKRLATGRKEINPNAEEEVASLCNTVAALLEQGRYDEAMEPAQRAVSFVGSYLGAEHPRTLAAVNNLAESYERQGRYKEAEPLLERALAAGERVLGEEHPQTLRTQRSDFANTAGEQPTALPPSLDKAISKRFFILRNASDAPGHS